MDHTKTLGNVYFVGMKNIDIARVTCDIHLINIDLVRNCEIMGCLVRSWLLFEVTTGTNVMSVKISVWNYQIHKGYLIFMDGYSTSVMFTFAAV